MKKIRLVLIKLLHLVLPVQQLFPGWFFPSLGTQGWVGGTEIQSLAQERPLRETSDHVLSCSGVYYGHIGPLLDGVEGHEPLCHFRLLVLLPEHKILRHDGLDPRIAPRVSVHDLTMMMTPYPTVSSNDPIIFLLFPSWLLSGKRSVLTFYSFKFPVNVLVASSKILDILIHHVRKLVWLDLRPLHTAEDDTHRVPIKTDRDWSFLRNIKTHRTLHLISQLLHQIFILPADPPKLLPNCNPLIPLSGVTFLLCPNPRPSSSSTNLLDILLYLPRLLAPSSLKTN